jgi:hypothetical protein
MRASNLTSLLLLLEVRSGAAVALRRLCCGC